MYSTIYSFLRWCPGGLGILLRQKCYPYLLGKCGRKVLIGRFVTIKNAKRIHLKNNIVISDNAILDADGFSEEGAAITLEDHVFIGAGSSLQANAGKITVKTGSSIGSFCTLKTQSTITIGSHTLLAAYCKIGYVPETLPDKLKEEITTERPGKKTTIDSGCWLGVRSIILPGVIIGSGSIIGAHTVVQESMPPEVIAVGAPAKVIRNRFT